MTAVHHQPLYYSCVPGSSATWRALSLNRFDDLRGLTFSKPRFPHLWNGLITCLNWYLIFFMYAYVAVSVMRIKCDNTGKMFVIILIPWQVKVSERGGGEDLSAFYLIQFCRIGILSEVTLRRYPTSSPEPQEKMGSPLCKREEARRGSIKVFWR